jgi:ATP-dependent RNA helicase SUPV3L1/SUV3
VEIRDDFKIYWNKSSIAKLVTGKNYLNPNIELLVDDILEQNLRQKLIIFLEKWLKNKIEVVLKSLIDLKNLKEKNSSVKALAYQLYENNGVLKRSQVSEYLKNLEQNERKILRDLGVKFGRYHVFLYRLIKPEPVSLRTLLWKNYHQKYFNLKPPTFGLNFLDDNKFKNDSFMLLCGFEKFNNFYIRIDILERLFVQIINSNSDKGNEIKMTAEMLNLLGCTKENFKKLLKSMEYKILEKDNDIFFRYVPKKSSKKPDKKIQKETPFGILKNLNFS